MSPLICYTMTNASISADTRSYCCTVVSLVFEHQRSRLCDFGPGEHGLQEVASRQAGALGQVAVAVHAWPTRLNSRGEDRLHMVVSRNGLQVNSNSVLGRKTLMAGSRPVHHHPEDPTHTFHPSHANIDGYFARVGSIKPLNLEISD